MTKTLGHVFFLSVSLNFINFIVRSSYYLGGITQMVECALCKRDVKSSSLFTSKPFNLSIYLREYNSVVECVPYKHEVGSSILSVPNIKSFFYLSFIKVSRYFIYLNL